MVGEYYIGTASICVYIMCVLKRWANADCWIVLCRQTPVPEYSVYYYYRSCTTMRAVHVAFVYHMCF